ncbi:site-specific integrase [Pseudomonas sp. C32]|jgi:integrase|uniref:tyrosine-type recombinase/integrase n=1 Tax=Pseudomonas sp. C32 TaxID=1529208 RepID=UPI002610E371|nr:site-specific integrase [Pseudomonas sp. C32]MDN4547000.1 site-specific integrase [Pseudomonas sp. C32]
MKNVLYVNAGYPRLYEMATGEPIQAFNTFSDYICNQIRHTFSGDVPEQYTYNLGKFFDFCYETGVMGATPLDEEAAQKTINLYYDFLTKGSESKDYVIRKAALALKRNPISSNSANTYIAPVNKFLHISQAKLKDSARLLQILTGNNSFANIKALPVLEDRTRTAAEMAQISNSTLKFGRLSETYNNLAAGGIPGGKIAHNNLPKHFPVEKILLLLNGIKDPMHRCCAALMASGGIRQSELWPVRLKDIDENARTVQIEDPNFHRNPGAAKSHIKMPFKGRLTAAVILFEPFKSIFFEALIEYLQVRPTTDSEYLFVSDKKETYGMPLLTCQKANTTNKQLNRSLKKTQKKHWPDSPPEEIYASHSLRHFYGTWARNFIYIPGRPALGLDLAEIQIIMGHKDIKSTEVYAKLSEENLIAEIEIAERNKNYWGKNCHINEIRALVYIDLANELRTRGTHD